MDAKYCKLLMIESGYEITEYMEIAPEIGSLCSIVYKDEEYRVRVIDRKISPDKKGFWVTIKLADDKKLYNK